MQKSEIDSAPDCTTDAGRFPEQCNCLDEVEQAFAEAKVSYEKFVNARSSRCG